MKRVKIPQTWDECKTKEQKEAFKAELDRIGKTSKTISFEEYLKKCEKRLMK